MSGQKIIDGLKEAIAGDIARVTIEGQVWVREGDRPLGQNWPNAYAELREKYERLRADLAMLGMKADNAKREAIKARDGANLAVQYAADCEELVVRMLSP